MLVDEEKQYTHLCEKCRGKMKKGKGDPYEEKQSEQSSQLYQKSTTNQESDAMTNEDQDGGMPKASYNSHKRTTSSAAKTVSNAEKYKFFRYHFPQNLKKIRPRFNTSGKSENEIIEAEIAVYNKVSHITDAEVCEADGAAIFYAVEISWVYAWRDYCQKTAQRPGPINNRDLVQLIA